MVDQVVVAALLQHQFLPSSYIPTRRHQQFEPEMRLDVAVRLLFPLPFVFADVQSIAGVPKKVARDVLGRQQVLGLSVEVKQQW